MPVLLKFLCLNLNNLHELDRPGLSSLLVTLLNSNSSLMFLCTISSLLSMFSAVYLCVSVCMYIESQLTNMCAQSGQQSRWVFSGVYHNDHVMTSLFTRFLH